MTLANPSTPPCNSHFFFMVTTFKIYSSGNMQALLKLTRYMFTVVTMLNSRSPELNSFYNRNVYL